MFYIGTIKKWLRDRGRNIFQYWDGSRWQFADPIVVGSRLEVEIPDYFELLELLSKRVPNVPSTSLKEEFISKQRDAGKRITLASRSIFNLKPMDENGVGVTESEVMSILAGYLKFMEVIARESQLFRNSQGVASGSPAVSPIEHSAESGIVEKASS